MDKTSLGVGVNIQKGDLGSEEKKLQDIWKRRENFRIGSVTANPWNTSK
jgi:hypothetical protein